MKNEIFFGQEKNFFSENVKKIYQEYKQTFPQNERRNDNQFQRLFSEKKVQIRSVFWEENLVGYLILWEFSFGFFLEHLEVFSSYRNQKLGSKILKKLQSEKKNIFLESEPENLCEMAKRRLDFYKRNHFFVLDEHYLQPNYQKNEPPVPMFFLSSFEKIENLNQIKEEIYKNVYNFEF